MNRTLILFSILVVMLMAIAGGWWITTGRSRDALNKELAQFQTALAQCPTPIAFHIGGIKRAGLPWKPGLRLTSPEISILRENGQVTTLRFAELFVEAVETDMNPNGNARISYDLALDAGDVRSALAWRMTSPPEFTMQDAQTDRIRNVVVEGDIALLVLAEGAPNVSQRSRPVRLRMPSTLALTVDGRRKSWNFPEIATGWIFHNTCNTERLLWLRDTVMKE